MPELAADDAAHAECADGSCQMTDNGSCGLADLTAEATPVVRDPPHICKTDEDGNPICDFDANMAKAAELDEHHK